jgi:hypothetical protein
MKLLRALPPSVRQPAVWLVALALLAAPLLEGAVPALGGQTAQISVDAHALCSGRQAPDRDSGQTNLFDKCPCCLSHAAAKAPFLAAMPPVLIRPPAKLLATDAVADIERTLDIPLSSRARAPPFFV